jgi:poly(3-hydroxybutyrate) depolymerase
MPAGRRPAPPARDLGPEAREPVQRDQRPRRGRRTARERARRALAATALLLVALLVGLAAGCGDDAPEPEVLTLRSAGVPRQAIVVPARSEDEETPPLLLAFHGAGSSGAEMLAALTTLPEHAGATIVLPDALPCGSAAGRGRCWPAEADATGAGTEEAFVERLVDAVAERWPVDPERVYALGLSNGGAWTLRLLLDRPDLIRGGIVVAGYDPTRAYARAPDGSLVLPLTPLTPSAIRRPAVFRPLSIDHGTADELVPYPLALELFRTLTSRGWPGQTTVFHPVVGARHLDPQLLMPGPFVGSLRFIDGRAGTPPAPPAETAPSGATG